MYRHEHENLQFLIIVNFKLLLASSSGVGDIELQRGKKKGPKLKFETFENLVLG